MTEAQRDAIATPATGLIVYNTDTDVLNIYNGAGWAAVGSGGGGGGGSLQWIEGATSPLYVIENGVATYQFEADLTQSLCANVKVPESYSAGSPIKLFVAFYSNDTSGTALIQSVTTLIRSETDAVTSTTNQRTSTNSAVTLSAGTQNEPQTIELDLSSATGQVNSVSISPSDLLFVCLKRDTADTATSVVKVLVYNAEVTFQ